MHLLRFCVVLVCHWLTNCHCKCIFWLTLAKRILGCVVLKQPIDFLVSISALKDIFWMFAHDPRRDLPQLCGRQNLEVIETTLFGFNCSLSANALLQFDCCKHTHIGWMQCFTASNNWEHHEPVSHCRSFLLCLS